MTGVLIRGNLSTDTHTHRKKTEGEDDHLQAKEENPLKKPILPTP